jgi:hypothetical protein
MLRARKVTRVAKVALLTTEEEVALLGCIWGVEERQVEERQVGAGHA